MADPAPRRVLRNRLRDLAAQVRDADRMVREDDPDGVHALRVAMRRTRSLLLTFRSLIGDDALPEAERIRAELRWAGGELGAVRDLEVVHGQLFEDSVAEQVPESVAARLVRHREEAGRAARLQVADLLGSQRYARMLGDLEQLAGHVAWDGATTDAVRRQLRDDWRRLRRRAKAADAGTPAEHEVALHEVRKAAKRARYAGEALAPALGERAQQLADVAVQVQDALGAHRDTLLTRELLHRLAAEEGGDEEHVFALGRLHALEQLRGEEALADYERVRAELDRKRLRRWLAGVKR